MRSSFNFLFSLCPEKWEFLFLGLNYLKNAAKRVKKLIPEMRLLSCKIAFSFQLVVRFGRLLFNTGFVPLGKSGIALIVLLGQRWLNRMRSVQCCYNEGRRGGWPMWASRKIKRGRQPRLRCGSRRKVFQPRGTHSTSAERKRRRVELALSPCRCPNNEITVDVFAARQGRLPRQVGKLRNLMIEEFYPKGWNRFGPGGVLPVVVRLAAFFETRRGKFRVWCTRTICGQTYWEFRQGAVGRVCFRATCSRAKGIF